MANELGDLGVGAFGRLNRVGDVYDFSSEQVLKSNAFFVDVCAYIEQRCCGSENEGSQSTPPALLVALRSFGLAEWPQGGEAVDGSSITF